MTLFDLENDPFEKTNIANLHPEITCNMEKLLNDHRTKTQDLGYDIIDEDSDKIRGELKKLGYI